MNTKNIKKTSLILPVLVMLIAPLVASYFMYPVAHLPPGFGEFPPQFVSDPPGFNLWIFIVIALLGLGVLAFLFFPTLFGFRQEPAPPQPAKAPFPKWFWVGLGLTLVFWYLMWKRPMSGGLDILVYCAFTPMWWGFILVLDGLCYRFSGGYSLVAKRPKLLLISAAFSIFGWGMFEYLDYFSLGNWYYPNTVAGVIPLSKTVIVWLFILAYTTVWPAVFEWYVLLNCFPRLVAKYQHGPKIPLSGPWLILLGILLIVAMVFYPYPLFWVLWVGGLLVFSGILIQCGIPSPLSALAKGNWSPAVLMTVSSLLNGFFWEVWNYGSAHPESPVGNPNYWIYNIPYVNVIHIFAEMPLLGFFGYLPFGLLVWVMFIWAGKLLNFDTELLQEKK